MYACSVGRREGKDAERASIARQLNVAGGKPMPRFVVPQLRWNATRQAKPTYLLIAAAIAFSRKRVEGLLEQWRASHVALGESCCQSVQKEVGGTRCGRGQRRGASRLSYLKQPAPAAQAASEDRRRERFEIRFACKFGVKRFEPFRRFEEQPRSIPSARAGEHDLGSQPRTPRALEVVQRAAFRHSYELVGSSRRSRVELRLGGGQRALAA